jgi:hypothetical protein
MPGVTDEKADKKANKKRTKAADEKKAPEGAFSGLLPSGFGR